MGKPAYIIDCLTHEQVRKLIDKTPSVIIPLGGCEPFGTIGTLGAGAVCAQEIAKEASARCGVLAAPLIPFGCSAPFAAFHGAAGVKPRTFVNMLCEIIGGYVFQGIKKFYLINAAPFNIDPALDAMTRLQGKHSGIVLSLFDINNSEMDRDDAVLLSMAAYLRPDTFAAIGADTPARLKKPKKTKDPADAADVSGSASILEAKYRAWKKRGRDPQKLRALFPNGLLLPPNADIAVCPDAGKKHFERLVGTVQREINADRGR